MAQVTFDHTNAPEQKLRRKKGAGVMVQLMNRQHHSPLPTIVLANILTLENKLDELLTRMTFHQDTIRRIPQFPAWLVFL